MPTIFQLPLNLEPIFWWREIWGTSTCKGHLPKNKKKYINKSKTASFEILFQKVAPNSPCSLPSLSLWSCYITPPPLPSVSLQARPALPPMTGKPSSDRLVQVSGTKWTDGRGQRRTNNKGALLFSSSGWLGSSLRHEQDKPLTPSLLLTPPSCVPCDHRLGTSDRRAGLPSLTILSKKSNDVFSFFK